MAKVPNPKAPSPTTQTKQGRPLGVTILIVLFLLGLIGTLPTLAKAEAYFFGYLVTGPAAVIITLILLVILGLEAYGFWTGMRWAWWLAVANYVYSIISSIGSLANINTTIGTLNETINATLNSGTYATTMNATMRHFAVVAATGGLYLGYIFGIIVALIILFYLTRPRVKAWFGVK